MNLRPLLIDDALKARIAEIRAFAERPENYYHWQPDGSVPPPGDDPRYVLQLPFGGWRAVFSVTVMPDGVKYRHFSLSVAVGPPFTPTGGGSGKYPNPYAAFELATLFGLSGWDGQTINPLPEGWQGDSRPEPVLHVILAQPFESPPLT